MVVPAAGGVLPRPCVTSFARSALALHQRPLQFGLTASLDTDGGLLRVNPKGYLGICPSALLGVTVSS